MAWLVFTGYLERLTYRAQDAKPQAEDVVTEIGGCNCAARKAARLVEALARGMQLGQEKVGRARL